MKPITYYGNMLASGSLTGSENSNTNPVRKVSDGSINLPYTITATTTVLSGSVEVTLASAEQPDTLVFPRAELLSGHFVVLQSEDVGGGSQVTLIDSGLVADAAFLLIDVPAGTPRRVWRVMISGASGLVDAKAHEIQLATKMTFARSPEVGVSRTRVRQFTRIPIPGGQPFVQRTGRRLRQTRFRFPAVSGSEVDAIETFIDHIEGGNAFTLTDDLGDSYWSELLTKDQVFDDQAGVFVIEMTMQEIRAD